MMGIPFAKLDTLRNPAHAYALFNKIDWKPEALQFEEHKQQLA